MTRLAASRDMFESVRPAMEAAVVCRKQLTGPRAWQGGDFTDPTEWNYQLERRTLIEIDAAINDGAARMTPGRGTGESMLRSFGVDAEPIRHRLRRGAGFLVISGLPERKYTWEEQSYVFRSLLRYLGSERLERAKAGEEQLSRDGETPVIQSAKGSVRRFSNDPVTFEKEHAPDVVAQMIPSSGGGKISFTLVSGEAIHNLMLDENPDLLERLYESFYFAGGGDDQPTRMPVFAYQGRLIVRYGGREIRAGYEQAREPMDSRTSRCLSRFESVLQRGGVGVQLVLQPGEILLTNNRLVLRSETLYDRWMPAMRGRRLIKAGLKLTVDVEPPVALTSRVAAV